MAMRLYYRAEVTCQYDEQDAGYRCDCSAAQESIEIGEMPPESARDAYAHHFRKVTGQTPAAYIRELRLTEAAALLRKTRYSVKEVAVATGFADSNHLCRVFRQHFGASPVGYRRLYGEPTPSG